MAEPNFNKVIVGKAYNVVDEINYKEITERLVKLERTLTGYADSYNIHALVPIGSIIDWPKSLTGVPALTDAWAECNGQTLDDPSSPLHGTVIPNLNGDASGANLSNGDNLGKTGGVYLKSSTTSGVTSFDKIQGHTHGPRSPYTHYAGYDGTGSFGLVGTPSVALIGNAMAKTGDPLTDGVNGTPRTGANTEPRSYTVVKIMRVK
jgi:hypothetical protein